MDYIDQFFRHDVTYIGVIMKSNQKKVQFVLFYDAKLKNNKIVSRLIKFAKFGSHHVIFRTSCYIRDLMESTPLPECVTFGVLS